MKIYLKKTNLDIHNFIHKLEFCCREMTDKLFRLGATFDYQMHLLRDSKSNDVIRYCSYCGKPVRIILEDENERR